MAADTPKIVYSSIVPIVYIFSVNIRRMDITSFYLLDSLMADMDNFLVVHLAVFAFLVTEHSLDDVGIPWVQSVFLPYCPRLYAVLGIITVSYVVGVDVICLSFHIHSPHVPFLTIRKLLQTQSSGMAV